MVALKPLPDRTLNIDKAFLHELKEVRETLIWLIILVSTPTLFVFYTSDIKTENRNISQVRTIGMSICSPMVTMVTLPTGNIYAALKYQPGFWIVCRASQ